MKRRTLSRRPKTTEEKSIHHHRVDPPFFLFPGLRLYGVYPSFRTYGVYPSFRTYGVYPFPFFSQENGIHHSFFSSVTSGSGDRPRKEGSRGGGVYSFFPCKTAFFFKIRAPTGELPICPKTITLQHIFWTIHFGRRNVIITSQKVSWNYFWAP